jgi:hypothetical protein
VSRRSSPQMHFSWKRWWLPLAAMLTAVAMSLALAIPASAAEPGESGTWTAESVNGPLAANGTISQARNGGYLMDVWRGATNNTVWMSVNNGNPFTLGSTTTYYSPTVVPYGSGYFMILHVGTNNNIYYTIFNPANGFWSGYWPSIPGQSTNAQVSATQDGVSSTTIELAYHANDSTNRVWSTDFNGSEWGFAVDTGGISPTAPSVVYNSAVGVTWIVARGTDNQIWMVNSLPNSTWGSWRPQGGFTYEQPTIAALPDGNMLVSFADPNTSRPNYGRFTAYGTLVGGWSEDITGWQSYYPVFLSVVGNAIYALLTGTNDGFVFYKQAYTG